MERRPPEPSPPTPLRARALQHLERCMAQFEDFCVVTESIRHGIPVSVEVVDAAGRPVHAHGEPALT